MNKSLQQVKEFHELFNVPVLNKPELPEERFELRLNLIEEEFGELKEALYANDPVEVIDALADLKYVLNGAIIEFGMQDVFDEAFDRVHESNMSKACKSVIEAIDTMEHYKKTKGIETYSKPQKDGTYIVYRKEDDKVLKSINYKPVKLADLV